METVVVGIADGKVIKHSGKLVTYALGSCVGICLYEPSVRLAGMAHILLPYQKDAVNQSNGYKFADMGIRLLIEEMVEQGAKKGRLTAKIAGGAEMFQNMENRPNIGLRNVRAVKEMLKKEGIPVIAEDTGASYGRTIYFSAENGELTVKSVGRKTELL